jgi:hypothetical protein
LAIGPYNVIMSLCMKIWMHNIQLSNWYQQKVI